MKPMLKFAVAATVACAAPGFAQDKPLTPEESDFFESKIRPALIEHCHKCHSGDKDAKIKGGLQLDSKAGLLKGGSTGPGLVAGQPDRSLIIKAIRFADPNLQMPPKEKLPDSVIADFENWVRMGAPDPRTGKAAAVLKTDEDLQKARKHWAFQTVVKPEPPKPKAHLKGWIQNEIDLFVLAKLEEKGLFPSPIADKWTLVRRAYFDLLGMPPSAKEAEDFVNDTSKDAWPNLLDKLLASPHYGERWGRYWLDIARYADTRGANNNNRMGDNRLIHAFTYRDWVVNALNEDMPYDKFLKYQIAADSLPGAEAKHLAALGFITMNRAVNNRQEEIDDRIDVITRGTMSLSVYCARCHDHKFDPIPTKDYYSLYGVFDSTTYSMNNKPVIQKIEDTKDYREYTAKKAQVEARLEGYRQGELTKFVGEAKGKTMEYMLAVHFANQGNTNYMIEGRAGQQRFETFTKLQFEVAGPWKRYLDQRSKGTDPIFAPWADYAKLEEKEFAAKSKELAAKYMSKDGVPMKGLNPIVAKAFSTPVSSIRVVADRYAKLFLDAERAWVSAITLDSKKKKADDDPMLKKLSDPAQEQLRQVFYGQGSPVNITYDRLAGFDNNRIRNGEQQFQLQADTLDALHPGAPRRAMALSDTGTPRNAKVALKGDPRNLGPEVPRQFLEVLNPNRKAFSSKSSGRVELAEEIASKNNPLTARVLANRVWMNHFGGALVRTPTDFGVRADDPTHPELLNFLSAWVMENGWSLKKFHKFVMSSATYMQSSDDRAKPLLNDPANLYVWKMNRRRLDFEGFRDSLLAVSGKLDPTMGGHPVKITPEGGNPLGYPENPYRRTLYGYIDRGNLSSLYRTFDFANPDATAGMRFSSTVPQQALYLMNSPFVGELARAIVHRDDVKNKVDEEQRIEMLYQICFQRLPSALETKIGMKFLEDQSGVKGSDAKPIWQYGYGQYNPRTRQVSFFKFQNFVGAPQGMMGGNRNPAAAPHYDGGTNNRLAGIRLTANGGTASTLAVIRRFTAPVDASLAISGDFRQPGNVGDGVNGYIVHSRSGQVGSYPLSGRNRDVSTAVAKVDVKRGDTIDFIVDNGGRGNAIGDTFIWAPTLRVAAAGPAMAAAAPAMTPFGGGPMSAPAMNNNMAMGGQGGASATRWDAQAQFGSPSAGQQKPLDTWEKYAQILLLANEMTFVD
ncbi:MAG: hypothetical protein FD161_3439 [Limisphaerales bacterium]|nr:MAG: hypothetical protein FD161_3439 [Limisphaerales bacterium]KAG0507760.1 MAG: hypothetical protein E1N63_3105 [Limisphaerales bacterium]TXT51075.1 MAG: hypothetical protein FD140_1921 [Limisphaerales bacterium]